MARLLGIVLALLALAAPLRAWAEPADIAAAARSVVRVVLIEDTLLYRFLAHRQANCSHPENKPTGSALPEDTCDEGVIARI